MSKLLQMLGLIEQSNQHSSHAAQALCALDNKAPQKLVNKHLWRIAKREHAVSEFIEHIANSKAFEEEGDYEE